MEDTLSLKEQIAELTQRLNALENGQSKTFNGNLDQILIERVINTDTTNGTPPGAGVDGPYPDNNLLYQLVVSAPGGDFKIPNFPPRVMIYKWKNQRLAVPVYDADNIIYP